MQYDDVESVKRMLAKLGTMARFGRDLARLSACKRAQCGVLVFAPDCSQVYSVGYNGPPRGTDNASCTGVEGDCGCAHAEANAIAKLDPSRAKPALMFSTTSPCVQCANMVVNCGAIVAVIYDVPYRDQRGGEVLRRGGVFACLHAWLEEGSIEACERMLRWRRLR